MKWAAFFVDSTFFSARVRDKEKFTQVGKSTHIRFYKNIFFKQFIIFKILTKKLIRKIKNKYWINIIFIQNLTSKSEFRKINRNE